MMIIIIMMRMRGRSFSDSFILSSLFTAKQFFGKFYFFSSKRIHSFFPNFCVTQERNEMRWRGKKEEVEEGWWKGGKEASFVIMMIINIIYRKESFQERRMREWRGWTGIKRRRRRRMIQESKGKTHHNLHIMSHRRLHSFCFWLFEEGSATNGVEDNTSADGDHDDEDDDHSYLIQVWWSFW